MDIISILFGISIIAQFTLIGLMIFMVYRLETLVKRLEQASEDNRAAALTFRSAIGALVIQSDETGAIVLRMEQQAFDVAKNLLKSQNRADGIPVVADPGVASDAASRGEVGGSK